MFVSYASVLQLFSSLCDLTSAHNVEIRALKRSHHLLPDFLPFLWLKIALKSGPVWGRRSAQVPPWPYCVMQRQVVFF